MKVQSVKEGTRSGIRVAARALSANAFGTAPTIYGLNAAPKNWRITGALKWLKLDASGIKRRRGERGTERRNIALSDG
jgi:hypothetical protein